MVTGSIQCGCVKWKMYDAVLPETGWRKLRSSQGLKFPALFNQPTPRKKSCTWIWMFNIRNVLCSWRNVYSLFIYSYSLTLNLSDFFFFPPFTAGILETTCKNSHRLLKIGQRQIGKKLPCVMTDETVFHTFFWYTSLQTRL